MNGVIMGLYTHIIYRYIYIYKLWICIMGDIKLRVKHGELFSGEVICQ